jgi:hypothetical protein
VLSFEWRLEASVGPEDFDKVRGRPHEDRRSERSVLGFGGGLSCKGKDILVIWTNQGQIMMGKEMTWT